MCNACSCNTMRQLLLHFKIRKIAKEMSVQLSFSEEQTKAFVPLLCTLGLTPPLKESSVLYKKKKKHTKSTEAQGAFLVREKKYWCMYLLCLGTFLWLWFMLYSSE